MTSVKRRLSKNCLDNLKCIYCELLETILIGIERTHKDCDFNKLFDAVFDIADILVVQKHDKFLDSRNVLQLSANLVIHDLLVMTSTWDNKELLPRLKEFAREPGRLQLAIQILATGLSSNQANWRLKNPELVSMFYKLDPNHNDF